MDDKERMAIQWLVDCQREQNRTPTRAMFTPEQVCLIKQKLGPWPRALERAGLKSPPPVTRLEKNRAKRRRIHRNKKRLQREEAMKQYE